MLKLNQKLMALFISSGVAALAYSSELPIDFAVVGFIIAFIWCVGIFKVRASNSQYAESSEFVVRRENIDDSSPYRPISSYRDTDFSHRKTDFSDGVVNSSVIDTELTYRGTESANFGINPASGEPMTGGIGGVDISGNPYGSNYRDDSNPFS